MWRTVCGSQHDIIWKNHLDNMEGICTNTTMTVIYIESKRASAKSIIAVKQGHSDQTIYKIE